MSKERAFYLARHTPWNLLLSTTHQSASTTPVHMFAVHDKLSLRYDYVSDCGSVPHLSAVSRSLVPPEVVKWGRGRTGVYDASMHTNDIRYGGEPSNIPFVELSSRCLVDVFGLFTWTCIDECAISPLSTTVSTPYSFHTRNSKARRADQKL